MGIEDIQNIYESMDDDELSLVDELAKVEKEMDELIDKMHEIAEGIDVEEELEALDLQIGTLKLKSDDLEKRLRRIRNKK